MVLETDEQEESFQREAHVYRVKTTVIIEQLVNKSDVYVNKK